MSYTIDKDWLLKNCDKEDNLEISAGSLDFSTVKFKKSKTAKSRKPRNHKIATDLSIHQKKRTRKVS